MRVVSTTDEFERDLKRMKKLGKDLAELFAVVEILAGTGSIDADAYSDHELRGE